MSNHEAETIDHVDAEIRPASSDDRKQAIVDFVRDHPALVVAGGVAAGLVIGALLPKSTKVKRRASRLGSLLSAAAVSFGHDAAGKAQTAGKGLRHGGEVVADRTEEWTSLALRSATVLATNFVDHVAKLSDAAAGGAERFGDAAADKLGEAGRRASKRIDKAVPAVEAAASTAGKRVSGALTELRDKISH